MSLWNRNTLQFSIFCVSFFLLISWLPAANSQLSITCTGPDGQPLSGVKVITQNLTNGSQDDEKTNQSGVAVFKKLKDGVYRVLAREKGFEPALYEFVLLKGDEQHSLTLNFEQGDHERKLYFEDPELAKDYDQFFKSAVQSIQANQMEEAENSLVKALEIIPSDPAAQYYLGFARLRQSKWEGATDALQMAVDATDARIALDQGGQTEQLQQVKDEAQKLLDRIPQLELYDEGNSALANQQFDVAIEKFEEFVQSYPDDANPDTYYNIALAYTHAGNLEEATNWIERALAERPDDAAFDTLKRQIDQRKEQARLQQASSLLSEADEQLQQEQWEPARQKYEKALSMVSSPQHQATIWKQIAITYDGGGEHAQAEEAYLKAISLAEPEKKEEYRDLLAQFYDRTENYEALLEMYAGSDSGGSAATLFQQGQQLSKKGKQLLAQRFYEKAVELDPQMAQAYYELGMIYFYDRKEPEKAEKMLKKFTEIGTDENQLSNAKGVLTVIESQKKKR